MKQVDSSHYAFARYMSPGRWSSLWHQLDEVSRLQPQRVLEVGPGAGVFKAVAKTMGLAVETLDPDPDLQPDHVGRADALPFADASFDVCCAFQVLEHLPYPLALQAFGELARVARTHVVISLPDARPMWHYRLHLPRIGARDWLLPRPFHRPRAHVFDGEHHWELNTLEHPLPRVLDDLRQRATLLRHYRVPSHAYHHFFVFAVDRR